jgi:serine protease Do
MTPGQKVDAELIRNGKKRVVTIEVGALPEESGESFATSDSGDELGLKVQNLDAETRAAMRIAGGVVVEEISPDSAAQLAGLRPGDVILQLGNRAIKDVDDYTDTLKRMPKGVPVLIRFLRQGQFIFRTIEIAP